MSKVKLIKKGHPSAGFSLPELIIAGTLLALVITALTTSMRVSDDMEVESELRRQALARLKSYIDSNQVLFRPKTMIEFNTVLPNSGDIPCILRPPGDGINPISCTIEIQDLNTSKTFTATYANGATPPFTTAVLGYKYRQVKLHWTAGISDTIAVAVVVPRIES